MTPKVADRLRRPIFFAAVALAVLVILVEVGAATWLPALLPNLADGEVRTVGLGIAYLALVDGLVLFTLSLMLASLVVPERVHGRVQGIVMLVVSIVMLIVSFLLLLAAFGLLILMVTLLAAAPFGTAVYFARYASFPTGTAAATLGLVLALKFGVAGCLLAAHQRMLQNKGLVMLVLTGLLAHVVVSFLHALVPGFLVAITDAAAATLSSSRPSRTASARHTCSTPWARATVRRLSLPPSRPPPGVTVGLSAAGDDFI
jgi:hypothetical protein